MKRNTIKILVFLHLCLIVAILFVGCSSEPYLMIKGHKLFIEVAVSDTERQKGLSGRDSLNPDSGMLFVFENEKVLSFWMKGTRIPLSIAFIKEDGTVIGIYDMQPFSLATISSFYPCKYALEVNQGYYTKVGLETGDVIDIPDLETLKKWNKTKKK